MSYVRSLNLKWRDAELLIDLDIRRLRTDSPDSKQCCSSSVEIVACASIFRLTPNATQPPHRKKKN